MSNRRPNQTRNKNKKRKRKNQRKTEVLANIVVVLLVVIGSVLLYALVEHRSSNNKVVVVLDPRHDELHPGITQPVNELEYNNKLVDALEEKLSSDHQFKVIRSLDKDTNASSVARGKVADKNKADIVLSFGLSEGHSAKDAGMQIYAEPVKHSGHKESVKVAQAIEDAFSKEEPKPIASYYYLKPIGNNVYAPHLVPLDDKTSFDEATFPLFENTSRPAVVIQPFYSTNEAETKKWMSDEGIQEACELYYQALKKAFGDAK